MRQALEEYYREVEEKAERFEREEVLCRRNDHLMAFNLGRIAQRVEKSRHELWLRIAWLLLGLAVGFACGRLYPTYLYPALAHKFFAKTGAVVRIAERMRLVGLWRNLHA
jgi:hypothetical protein